jgi:hypothetical protein
LISGSASCKIFVELGIVDAKNTMGVVLRNNNSTLSMNQFEVYDDVAKEVAGVFTLKGGESRTISICRDNAGKGKVRLRNLESGLNEWVEIDSISPGDIISA